MSSGHDEWLLLGVRLWWVDPGLSWRSRGLRFAAGETLRVPLEGGGKHLVAGLEAAVDAPHVDVSRGEEGEARVAVFVVVPLDQDADVSPGVLDRSEAVREAGPVLEGPELGLGERVVLDVCGRLRLRTMPKSA